MLEELKRFQKGLSFDQLPCANLSAKALDQARIDHFLQTIGKNNRSEKLLGTLGILSPHTKPSCVSNGGLILFGKDEERSHYFPEAHIKCARFKGTDKSVFIDRKEFRGSLLDAIPEVLKFIQINTRLGGRIRSLYREDTPEYPDVAIREVLINAIVHADYSLKGSIQLAIFDDRLEIQNPGMLPFGLTLEDFKEGVSRIRNHVIARVFRELDLIEEWGSGFRRSIAYCEEFGYSKPQWQEIGSTMRVTFHPHPETQEDNDPLNRPNVPVNVPVNLRLNERQTWFLSEIAQGSPLRARDLAKKWDVTEKTAKRDIAFLQKQELLHFVGSAKTGAYKLLSKK